MLCVEVRGSLSPHTLSLLQYFLLIVVRGSLWLCLARIHPLSNFYLGLLVCLSLYSSLRPSPLSLSLALPASFPPPPRLSLCSCYSPFSHSLSCHLSPSLLPSSLSNSDSCVCVSVCLAACQKRTTIVSKETYYSVKRDLICMSGCLSLYASVCICLYVCGPWRV